MKNTIYTIFTILISLIAGKALYSALGGLPGSLYGMIIYCLLLQLGWFNPEKIKQANQWMIRNMGVCFIPAAVGVINHFELFKNHGYAIVGIVFFTTFLLITFVGVLAEKHLTTTPRKLPKSTTDTTGC